MVDGRSDVPLPDRLSRIRDLRVNWGNLIWEGYKDLPLDISEYRSHDFAAGVLAILAGKSLKGCGRTLEYESPEIPFGDFSIDPTQDLLVFLQNDARGQVHLRTLSTNESHPGAQEHVLNFLISSDPDSVVRIRKAFLHIASNVLALFIVHWHNARRLLIWDWHNGALIYDSGEDFGPNIQYFSLLNRSSFVLTSNLDSVLAACLHLPPIKSPKYVYRLSVDSGMIQAEPAEGSLFFTSPDSHILAFSITYADFDIPHDSGHSYELFVHNHTLLKYIQNYSAALDGNATEAESRPLSVHWDEWGEHNTRLLPCPEPMFWSRYPDNYLPFIDVLDFNMARVSMSDVDAQTEHHLCTEPSKLLLDVFESPLAMFYHSYIIDEERLIAVDVDSHNHHYIKGLQINWF
ncbi:hypothetical protein CPB84DRAFT_1771078 [Gymnopilus junonius]|uniref:Uncharacterized protein n=1 Tax=Gymnopilus junonius TaxID=109634 RepID=A0A9P5NTC3_GYMJU|nr:hypothetical protein CPB84DRAFT_1771078 [Gymnopilus junonius]